MKRDGTLGGNSARVSVINESGMYSLVLSSKKPEAREFKRWVTSEALPNNGNANVSSWYSVTPVYPGA
nr:Bro-N domain-containing protein [Burkholderia sp. BCC1988]